MMKLGFAVIATLCLFLSNINNSNAEFSSLLKTVVGNSPVTPIFRINGPNGYCANATNNYLYLQLSACTPNHAALQFRFYDDGTLRVNGRCLTALALNQGAFVRPGVCNNPNRNAITWQVQITDRQILHPATGLVLTALSTTLGSHFTLNANLFSSLQTFRLDYNTPVPTAHIVGMNGLSLLSLNNEVWLGICGSSVALQKWSIYPDGTIRPQQSTTFCLSFDNLTSRRVITAYCGLAPSTGRWVLTDNSTLLNERTNLVLDVEGANPSLRRIIVYSPTGGGNQQWRIFYD